MDKDVREHPDYEKWEGKTGLKPLYDGRTYQSAHDEFIEMLKTKGLQAAVDYFGGAPDANDYMPRWSPEEATHYMMYEDTSEGTPISPSFATPEELARWLRGGGRAVPACSGRQRRRYYTSQTQGV